MFSSLFFSLKRYSCAALALLLLLFIGFPDFGAASVPEGNEYASVPTSLFVKSEESTSLPSVSAKSAVLIEEESGEIIAEKNANRRLPMASTTKIMTALIVIENCVLSDEIKIPASACGIEGSSVYLREGEVFSVEELLYALMLASANDAATALAIHTSGSVEEFSYLMNKRAKEMGLKDTHFENPHGLPGKEHYTTAYELALIAREACKNQIFKRICSTKKIIIRQSSSESARLLVNHNKLLLGLDGCFGIKTGFTKESGRCLVSGVERDGLSLIAVTLDAPSDWNDHKTLFDHGFSLYKRVTLIRKGDFSFSVPLVGGYQASIICKNTEEVSVVLPKKEEVQIIKKTELENFMFAPVEKGYTAGRIIFLLDGKVIAESKIEAAFSADKKK